MVINLANCIVIIAPFFPLYELTLLLLMTMVKVVELACTQTKFWLGHGRAVALSAFSSIVSDCDRPNMQAD